MKRFIVGITGASGAIYAKRLLEFLASTEFEIHLVISKSAAISIYEELDVKLNPEDLIVSELLGFSPKNFITHRISDIAGSIASGSFKTDGMVIVPCSMSTMGALAAGICENLIHRAAEVCMKEGRKLIIVPRETPLSSIHIENMLKLSGAGIRILPAMPAFYHRPKSINDQVDFIVCKILDQLEVENNLIKRWKETRNRG